MRPNVIYMVLDDVGFSDLGCYGSEIATPNIDNMAKNGLRYNNFNATPMCSPTRASLLSGRNHHSIGMGSIADVDFGDDFPNIRGRINDSAATISEVLREHYYSTFCVGKWHLTPANEVTPAGPF
ncbi:arylsulfatase [Alteribacillus bidgolensis]|uniref:Arylsulfatase n=1 Tax=Alteribacillus bidgolensis TaxID=930129 RepID=A0A1G8QUX2_9BACI|nr:arylsulfatase [Alteribacillus bidgolensis]